MDFARFDRMTDPVRFGKEPSDERAKPEDEHSSDYYYDDSTGYRIYNPEADDSDDEEQEDPHEE